MTPLEPKTKLSKALALHPDVLLYIVSLNPHEFKRLNSPLMQKLMPSRISLARLALMVDMPIADLINGIYAAAYLKARTDQTWKSEEPLPLRPTKAPNWVNDEVVEVVDLLAGDERLDADPFVPLFPALKRAQVGEVLLIKHKWEPQPLYDVWRKLGIEHYAIKKSPSEWWIYLRKSRKSYRKNG